MKISGQCALVIGGARGMGQAFCEILLANGAKLVFGDILEDEGNKLAEILNQQYPKKVKFQKCSATNRKEVEELFDLAKNSFGIPSIVANAAGTIDETNKEHSRSIEVNLRGTIIVTDICISRLGKSNGGEGGVLIHLASITGLRAAFWGPIYTATKFAVVGYTRAWALPENFSKHGIRMNTICPTTVDTPFLHQVKDSLFPEKTKAELDEMPKEDKIRPETVAKAMVQLIEDDSKNGEALAVTHAEGFKYHQFADYPWQ